MSFDGNTYRYTCFSKGNEYSFQIKKEEACRA
jgi:hypothetical protein